MSAAIKKGKEKNVVCTKTIVAKKDTVCSHSVSYNWKHLSIVVHWQPFPIRDGTGRVPVGHTKLSTIMCRSRW